MKTNLSRRVAAAAVFLITVAGFAAGVWWFAFTSALERLDERAQGDLELAADRLTSQLHRFSELAVLLSDHPTLVPMVLDGSGDADAADDLLQAMADKTGSLELQLVRGQELLASTSSNGFQIGTLAAVTRAMNGALGSAHFVDENGRRRFAYAAPVFEPNGPARGAVVVTVEVSGVEWNWPSGAAAVFFTDENGVVFVTNRSELVLTSRDMAGRNAFPQFSARSLADHVLWSIDGGPYLPERALHLTRAMPVIDMTGEILLDLRPATNIALLQAAVAGALLLALGAIFSVASERRRTLNDRLSLEAAANATLEKRVQARTRELSAANTSLRHEVREREEAETALQRAQADLIQAGKLSALGQMSAGISHELNQPLMAIRSFADNAEVFLARGKPEVAAENLSRISELSRRMGRIIKNLRAFSRQEIEPIGDVNLVGVVDAVLELIGPRIATSDAQVNWERPDAPVFVRGGDVRLQQVVMNLASNALDAMSESPVKKLEISINRADDAVTLVVRDTGPGISEPDRMFDPFYSTKEVGQSEGMGLGLSISYGLVQSFGGAIKGSNHAQGGAVFTIELAVAGLEKVA